MYLSLFFLPLIFQDFSFFFPFPDQSRKNVACMGDRRRVYSVLVEISEVKNQLEDLGVDRRIILKWITRNETDRTTLDQDRGRRRDLVDDVTKRLIL